MYEWKYFVMETLVTNKVSIVLHAEFLCMEIKERIQKKAQELFRRYGVRSVTMDEIASHLGVSKKTIYQYFSDKDELVIEVADSIIKYAEQCCDSHCVHAENAIAELFQAMQFGQQMFQEINPAMLFDLEKYHPQAYKNFLQYKHQYMLKIIERNLLRGIREELYRDDINVDIITRFRLETMLLPLQSEIFPPAKYKVHDVHTILMEHFLFGIASQKGYKLIEKYRKRNKSKVNEK